MNTGTSLWWLTNIRTLKNTKELQIRRFSYKSVTQWKVFTTSRAQRKTIFLPRWIRPYLASISRYPREKLTVWWRRIKLMGTLRLALWRTILSASDFNSKTLTSLQSKKKGKRKSSPPRSQNLSIFMDAMSSNYPIPSNPCRLSLKNWNKKNSKEKKS